jgi:hypothetical protein
VVGATDAVGGSVGVSPLCMRERQFTPSYQQIAVFERARAVAMLPRSD